MLVPHDKILLLLLSSSSSLIVTVGTLENAEWLTFNFWGEVVKAGIYAIRMTKHMDHYSHYWVTEF